MIGVFTAPDATVLAALLAAVAAWATTAWNSHRTAKQTRPNGGSSMRDVMDRIESKIDDEVVPRLDRGSSIMARHADRLAALEAKVARDPELRTRATDDQVDELASDEDEEEEL